MPDPSDPSAPSPLLPPGTSDGSRDARDGDGSPFPSPVDLPIGPALDLHTFRPQDLGEVVPEYLAECRRRGILEVRVIHGKGTGQVLRSVHALLRRLPEVESFALAGAHYGGAGATLVRLKAP